MTKLKNRLITLLGFFSITFSLHVASAFDTGHHSDLTRSSMRSLGFNDQAIQVSQLENWLVDYYSNQPLIVLEEDLKHLHFDNLLTTSEIASYWNRFTQNSKAAFEQAARDSDEIRILAILGMSLHAVQDFYSHSNWVDQHVLSPDSYLTGTYFSQPITAASPNLRTGRYPNSNPFQPIDHGDGSPNTPGINHDAYTRRDWRQAYVFAFCASREWIHAVEGWVKGVPGGDAVWQKSLNLSISPPRREILAKDLTAAYRISEWAPGGHWKGPGSASPAEFAVFVSQWASSSDSEFVDHFKVKKWHRHLTTGLASDTLTPRVPIPSINHPFHAISVRTFEVREVPVGTFEPAIDVGGSADFFAKVRIGNEVFIEAMQMDKKSIAPYWDSVAFVPSTADRILIQYEIWDEDGAIAGDDDHCDIHASENKRSISVEIEVKSATLTGDFSGRHNNKENAISSAGNSEDGDPAQVRIAFSATQLAP